MKKHPILFIFVILAALFFFVISIGLVAVTLSDGPSSFSKKPIVVIEINGPIFESLDVLKELKELEEDKDVKAVVLRLNSPGGAVAPSQEIFEQVKQLKTSKKVIVSMGTVAASGAYYIACAADKIVASSGTITGSIGVIMEMFGLQHLANKAELEHRVIKSGQFKDVGNPFSELTEKDRQYLQNLTDDMYHQFVTAVAENRKIDLGRMKQLAEGKVYTGLQAKEVGLVDQLGNIYAAIDLARKEAGLSDKAKVRWPKEPTPFEKFLSGESAQLGLLGLWERLAKTALPLWMLQSKQSPQYRL